MSGSLYATRSQTLPLATEDAHVQIVNTNALTDWLPDTVFGATLQHIEYYLAVNNAKGNLLTVVAGSHYSDDGSFSFEFNTDRSSDVYTVTVKSTNYGEGITSSSVTINEESTDYTAAAHLYGSTFSNFDGLTSVGLSGQQVYEIQKQLIKFAGDAEYDIDTSTIQQTVSDTSAKTACDVTINGRPYRLISQTRGIIDVRFILADGSKQVFDSGIVKLSH